MISREDFLNLNAQQIAGLMHERGSSVGVIFLDGTRRWFIMEYHQGLTEGWTRSYKQAAMQRHIEIFKLCFEHGLETIVTPTLYPRLITRGVNYEDVLKSTGWLATQPDFLAFYEEYGVRVNFYGDYRQKLTGTPLESVCEQFEQLAKKTRKNNRRRLFYGIYASEQGESANDLAQLAIEHFQKTGERPDRQKLTELYYGEYIKPADLCISFDIRPLEYPLLAGTEDLYFTVAPSIYLDVPQIREILYDHLFLRSRADSEYKSMTGQDFDNLRDFYHAQRSSTLGVGTLLGSVWRPKQF